MFKAIEQCLYCGDTKKIFVLPTQLIKAKKQFNIIICEDCKLKGKKRI